MLPKKRWYWYIKMCCLQNIIEKKNDYFKDFFRFFFVNFTGVFGNDFVDNSNSIFPFKTSSLNCATFFSSPCISIQLSPKEKYLSFSLYKKEITLKYLLCFFVLSTKLTYSSSKFVLMFILYVFSCNKWVIIVIFVQEIFKKKSKNSNL